MARRTSEMDENGDSDRDKWSDSKKKTHMAIVLRPLAKVAKRVVVATLKCSLRETPC